MVDVPMTEAGCDVNFIPYDTSGMVEAQEMRQIVPIGGDIGGDAMGDEWSHFYTISSACGVPRTVMKIMMVNSRYLDLDCIRVLEDICNRKDPKILELGPGAGVATAEMSCIAQKYGRKATIHTLSMTPINPKLMFRSDLLRMGKANYEESLYARLLLVSRFRSRIFMLLDEPFIQKQFIGSVASVDVIADVLGGGYDLIYDCYGPASKNQVVLRGIIENLDPKTIFFKKPYGWADGAVLGEVALASRDRVRILLSDKVLIYGNEVPNREALGFMFHDWQEA